ncbi:MAG TPA: preprotein translocase subunit SecA [Steroidobacteraceae bacterium]|nr:preprotein translocase subunit SecA [Steroidobacteraceae bacterium]HNS27061.1 preprotein translocase subunit SecA [Steroidobacteraceae bacterium]
MLALLTRVFGSRNDRLVKNYARTARAITALEPALQALDDEALRGKTAEFRARLKDGASLDDLIVEAFAVVREVARRTLGMRHFDVQLIGGMVLHEGKIAEMRTGEGKTLVATLPAYLNALAGNGVHVVTVNEYLAQRDSDWMAPIYRFLGLTVGVIRNSQSSAEKREAYACDITYGTNNEFGFDYLRDNLAFRLEDRVQRGHAFAVVDEVDSILIDEARTPLIISGPAEESTEMYLRVNSLVPRLRPQQEENGPGDFSIDLKQKQVHITEEGHEHVERLMLEGGLLREGESLYDSGNIRLMHHLNAALRAHAIYRRDVEYIVRGGEVIIVDEFTGRTMQGRRWSDGLHQAIEAKEGVRVREENQTVASITFQNYFRIYRKLSGMTGTADTEAPEFLQIYGLEVVVIPTHRPMVRKDHADLVYLTKDDKFKAIIEDIRDCAQREQPVLVGTTSIETSEEISALLQKEGITHQVLNAKQHEREAHIVAQAGRPGAATIATNMAGRGTDIVLGGNLEAELAALPPEASDADRQRVRAEWQARHDRVVAAGGLHIIGTERHESRRIDNQLRGRSGRQGDPGSSRFYLSMEDSLMRIFGDPNFTKRLLTMAGMKQGEVIESRMLSGRIEKAQRKVESHNFDIRKQLLLFDDVANDQRKVIYQQRTEIMAKDDIADAVRGIRADALGTMVDQFVPKGAGPSDWDLQGLAESVLKDFNTRIAPQEWVQAEPEIDEETFRARIVEAVEAAYEQKVARIGVELMRHVEKDVMLRTLDQHWRDHLAAMDYLRQGIHLRGYAQKDYRYEYKREAFELFSAMLERVKFETASILAKIEVRTQDEIDREEEQRRQRLMRALQAQHQDAQSALAAGEAAGEAAAAPGGARAAGAGAPAGGVTRLPARAAAPAAESHTPMVRTERKVGRNEPCPCGSGKKYKHCHGALAQAE